MSGDEERTIEDMALQALGQSQMRGSERVLELVETVTVVPSFNVLLDLLQRLLDSLESLVQMSDLVLGGDSLEELRLAAVGFAGLVAQLTEDVAGGVVDQLETRPEVHELLVD